MKFLKGNLFVLFILILGMALPSCKSDSEDEPTGNNNNTGYPSDQTVFTSADEAKVYVDASIDQALAFADIANGFGITKPSAPQDTTYYDGSWWHSVGTIEYGTYAMDYEYLYQFLLNGTAQQSSVGADEMHTKIDLAGNYDLSQAGQTVNLVLHYFLDLVITGFNTAVYTLNGQGIYDYDYTVTVSGINTTLHYYLTYTYDNLQIPQNGGCPTGTILIDARPYDATVTFDGTSMAHVVIKKDGNTEKEYDKAIFCE